MYVTDDLKYIVWKDPKKPLEAKNKMKIFKIRSIEKGRCTEQLMRKNILGRWLAKDECSFAVLGRDRTIDLECATGVERDKWVDTLTLLLRYSQQQKIEDSKFEK